MSETVCSKCGDTGRIEAPLDLTKSGMSLSSMVTPCDCAAGQEWNRRSTEGFRWPSWAKPNPGGWNNA